MVALTLLNVSVPLWLLAPVNALLPDTDTQLTPAAQGSVTVKSCPVTPAAVMLTLYVPGAAQKPQFPRESAMMIDPGICWVSAESVKIGVTGVQGSPTPTEVHTVTVAPAMGARKPWTVFWATPS